VTENWSAATACRTITCTNPRSSVSQVSCATFPSGQAAMVSIMVWKNPKMPFCYIICPGPMKNMYIKENKKLIKYPPPVRRGKRGGNELFTL
jgi:hypothetical protein